LKGSDLSNSDTTVNETLRRVISTNGHELRLTNVKKLNITGSWIRLESDQGYVIINPANVLAFIVKGERVL
jgi:hypothetical protein